MKMRKMMALLLLALPLLAAAQQEQEQRVGGVDLAEGDDGLRLIEVNATTRLRLAPEEVAKRFAECGGDADHPGFIDVTDHPDLRPQPWQRNLTEAIAERRRRDQREAGRSAAVGRRVAASVAARGGQAAQARSVKDTVDALVAYGSRYYTLPAAREAALWIKAQFEAAAAGKPWVSVALFEHSWTQPSVIATVRGSHPTLAAERVVIGCHEDSTSSPTTNAPGADDDASGVASVLEAFRTYLAGRTEQPVRTVEFMAYSAEEVGLRGSQAIAEDYQSKAVKVVAMLQLDMTMYRGSSGTVGVVTDFTDANLNAVVRDLVSQKTTLQWQDTRCGYGCSDHASWTRSGYPASFVFETPFGQHNPNIHTPQDTQDKIDFDKGAAFATLGAAFATHFGDFP